MTTLPPIHVRSYNDGPDWPETPADVAAEGAYRQAFYTAVREASRLSYGELCGAVEAAWIDRRKTRESFEVHVPSYVYLDIPDRPELDGDQIMYVAGHEVDAARARGRVQGLELAKQFWETAAKQRVPEEVVQAFVLHPWAERLEPWLTTDTATLDPPISPGEMLSPQQRQVLASFKPPVLVEPGRVARLLPTYRSVRELIATHHWLKRPVIEGILRRGETMNIISAPKVGKSWLGTDLAITVATGGDWLDTFPTVRGDVLLIDNELHPETLASRFPKVAEARGIALKEFGEYLFVENLRGRLTSLLEMGPYFDAIEPGRFSLIVLDALYRMLPADASENDNAVMAGIYNRLDQIAARLACAIVCIHHSSKGLQSGKAVTDVGAGAGSQSRATDTHLILRPHQEADAVVLEAAVRSWPPVEPICLRWKFPVWVRDDSLDPADLRPDWPKRRGKKEKQAAAPPEPEWTPERFAEQFLTVEPQCFDAILNAAGQEGISKRKAKELLRAAESQGTAHRWSYGPRTPVGFATSPQSEGDRA